MKNYYTVNFRVLRYRISPGLDIPEVPRNRHFPQHKPCGYGLGCFLCHTILTIQSFENLQAETKKLIQLRIIFATSYSKVN